MTVAPIRIFYHLYNGPSWRPVWELHRSYLEPLLSSDLIEKLVVCCGGFADGQPNLGLSAKRTELRMASRTGARVNEFDTLAHLRSDCIAAPDSFAHVAYLHSKGSSAARLTLQGSSWSEWMARALCAVMGRFATLANAGFSAAGSNLAWGLFDPFESPRLHYSGNFWCATRQTIAATWPIDLTARESTVRHRAEWWLSTAGSAAFYNLFNSGLDHYREEGVLLDEAQLDARIAALASATPSAARAQAQQAFLERHVQSIMPASTARRLISNGLLSLLPYRSVPKLYSAHDLATRMLGSRRSAYFFCAQT